MSELTQAQIKQQDAVDNAIYRLLVALTEREIPWNIEEIGAIRDVTLPIVARHTGRTEYELYPWLCEEEADASLD